ncbi:MAG TPA: S1C family serine protease [Burkholderiales bacterium]|nr:S1C family serine protease [Burkholderiales bacterium]
MPDLEHWAFPISLQPKAEELSFDLASALDAVVMLRSEIPEEAFTASILGTERVGSGINIDSSGIVLTIGYLITEAEAIWLTTNDGKVVPAHALAHDFQTGFGLVQPLGRLSAPALQRSTAAGLERGDDVLVIGHGGREHALKAKVLGRREFAGYWEYVLDEAIFTFPAHPEWGGSALIDMSGRLAGVGSLLVQDEIENEAVKGNMMVPIDLLDPILEDLVQRGRRTGLPRPWLGLYAAEADGHIMVTGLARGGPADRAGVKLGDVVKGVATRKVIDLADFYRKVWRLGPAGTSIPLTLVREGVSVEVRVESIDRSSIMHRPSLQ